MTPGRDRHGHPAATVPAAENRRAPAFGRPRERSMTHGTVERAQVPIHGTPR